MSASKLVLIVFWTAVSVFAGIWIVRGFWRLRSEWQRRRAGRPSLRSGRAVLWRDPGPTDQLDLGVGPGGARRWAPGAATS